MVYWLCMLSLLELSDLPGKPKVKLDLPPCANGGRVRLHFTLRRTHGGRQEILVVEGQYRVVAVGLDAGCAPQRQVLSVESVGAAPMWRAVKKTPEWRRVVPPAKAPRTIIE